ncbi:MAG TPA: helix-turn-helix transcriptional regulator [Methyloceanibacter sp.]|nr:helix-turn-helix transcriptional regulator [Methyloceanibacter sp.]
MRRDKPKTGGRARTSGRAAGNIDAYVGGRIRFRRELSNLSQESLAARLGISSQQLQKYEAGINRISASRLFECSRELDVPVSFFFEGLEDAESPRQETRGPAAGNAQQTLEAAELLRMFATIDDASMRSKLIAHLRAFAARYLRASG